jgi:hypothetical protein
MIRDTSVADLWVPCWRPTLAWCSAWSGLCMHACNTPGISVPISWVQNYLWSIIAEKIVVRHSRCWRPQVCAGLIRAAAAPSLLVCCRNLCRWCIVSELHSRGHWEGSHADSSLQLAMEAGMWVVPLYAWPSSHDQMTDAVCHYYNSQVCSVHHMMVSNSFEQITPSAVNPRPRALLFLSVCLRLHTRVEGRGSHATVIFHLPRIRAEVCGGHLDLPSITVTVTLERKAAESKLWSERLVRLNIYSLLHVMGTGWVHSRVDVGWAMLICRFLLQFVQNLRWQLQVYQGSTWICGRTKERDLLNCTASFFKL